VSKCEGQEEEKCLVKPNIGFSQMPKEFRILRPPAPSSSQHVLCQAHNLIRMNVHVT
jgi:hypothetical protein